MAIKVAVNGPGRIGRNFIWSWADRKKHGKTDIEIVAINGVRGVEEDKNVEFFTELLKFDSTHGHHFESVPFGRETDGTAWVNVLGQRIHLYNNRGDLSTLPWKKHAVDIVIESTGAFRKRKEVEGHIKAGARKVIISAPGKEDVTTSIVMGVRQDIPANETVIDCASCTTNAIAAVTKIVNDNWGIERGYVITVHAPTEDQNILDGSHKDIRRARSLINNIIPTSTGAAKAVAKIIPELKGKIDAVSMRVPGAMTGSIVGLIADVRKTTTRDEVNKIIDKECNSSLKGVLACTDKEIVSSYIIGRSESGIIDKPLTNVIDGKQIVVWSWYDNERGYSNRLLDVTEMFGKK
ncbi:MAG: type I glyceraldehyde-3-phosphate dehydrogenase [Candidatus Aenigmarchaeota archaeon]|nr:type I glyceraldehyde-3-phosphate dehydrogenase [Candidatus Aenigmarchaeota archaeon]